jgi:lipoprotein-anchoring transpeptidase ErfK/SrfK
VLYRLNERYGSYGDIFYADASAFRLITPEEITPIHPEATDKRIIVNVNQQNLICYEGNNEVYFCQVATGRKLDESGLRVETWATPPGTHWVWRKLISLHMSGGGTGAGWDTMGIGWTSLFVGEGVAIHATFWHNDFGTPRSHGCVNVPADDAKWIFRWTTPVVTYNPGDITDNTYQGTKIEVIEPLY